MTGTAANNLPTGWALTTIGELVEVLRGVSYKKNDATETGGQGLIPILRATNIGDGLTFDELVFVPSKYISDQQLLHAGDIVVAASSGSRSVVGKAAMLRSEWMGSFGAFCYALRPQGQTEPGFLAYFLQTQEYRNQVSELSAGVNINNLRRVHIQGISVRLAPIPEQRRIVAEIEKQFTRLEAGVGAVKRVQANLKRYRAAVLKAAVEGRLVPTEAELARREGRSYEPASELLVRLVAQPLLAVSKKAQAGVPVPPKPKCNEAVAPDTTDLPKLPEGWAWASLNSLLREPLRNGHSAKGSGGEVGIPTFTLTAVTYGDFSPANIKLTVAEPRRVEDLWAEPDDIFIERSNTPELVGTARRYKGLPKVAIFPDLLIRVRVVGCVLPAYVEYVLQSPKTQQYFRAKAQGISGTMPKIDQAVVQQTPVPLPPPAEQRRIVTEVERRLSVIDELEMQVEANLKRAERLRQAILKRAFEGKLVPQDPNDEPASMLLERIRAERDVLTPQKRLLSRHRAGS